MAFEWDPDLATGIDELDRQHKRIFRFMNTLLTAVSNKHTRTALSGFVNFITKYADEHFVYEEAWMLRTGYPGYVAHKLAHDELRKEVDEIVTEYRTNGHSPIALIRMSTLMSDWFRRHIFGADFSFVSWLKKEGKAVG